MLITKADGTQEEFKRSKLERSLRRAGATKQEISTITDRIEGELHKGMKTEEIYRRAFRYLSETETPVAARYSMRRALFNLGPTGFPFETFLAKIFEAEGYKTKVGTTIRGKCAYHEIDVAAYKSDNSFAAEAKFHGRPGVKSDLKVALYCHARQIDLEGKAVCNADDCGIKEFWLITNTKFTDSAEKYAECTGLKLLSWNYPKNNNLHDLIKKTGLYPITVIPQLSSANKRELLTNQVILCRDLVKKPSLLNILNLSKKKSDAVLSSARQLCKQN